MSNYISIASSFGSILVWERESHETRLLKKYDSPYYFFTEDPNGEFVSMYGDKLAKIQCESKSDFQQSLNEYKAKKLKVFETDISPSSRVLMDNYFGVKEPVLNYSFFDIETNKDADGFSPASEARCQITMITVYNQWEDTFWCLALPPPDFVVPEDFIPDVTKYGYTKLKSKIEFISFSNEKDLLESFLDVIDQSDFISGWNSEFYDLVYVINRIRRLFDGTEYLDEKITEDSKANKLCFIGAHPPQIRMVEHFGSEEMTFTLSGRTHMDYLDMFKKFTFEGRASWKLDAICEEELGVKKLEFDGSIGDLYYDDFLTYATYNLIDVELIRLLDKKFKFVALVNKMAHENTVPFSAILGTTQYVDMSTINYAHHVLGVRVKDKDFSVKSDPVEGALVLTPHKGLHEFVGSVDINSLYPSIIRALNMSPETLIGQFETMETADRVTEIPAVAELIADAKKRDADLFNFILQAAKETDWRGIKNGDDFIHTALLLSGEVISLTGKEWKQKLIDEKWCVSAYGTIFSQAGKQGVMPGRLESWYSDRKVLQKQLKKLKEQEKDLLTQFEK